MGDYFLYKLKYKLLVYIIWAYRVQAEKLLIVHRLDISEDCSGILGGNL